MNEKLNEKFKTIYKSDIGKEVIDNIIYTICGFNQISNLANDRELLAHEAKREVAWIILQKIK